LILITVYFTAMPLLALVLCGISSNTYNKYVTIRLDVL